MLDKLKQKILDQFPERKQFQSSSLFDLIQKHINNEGLEGEEIAGLIVNHLHDSGFLQFEPHAFGPDMFYIV